MVGSGSGACGPTPRLRPFVLEDLLATTAGRGSCGPTPRLRRFWERRPRSPFPPFPWTYRDKGFKVSFTVDAYQLVLWLVGKCCHWLTFEVSFAGNKLSGRGRTRTSEGESEGTSEGTSLAGASVGAADLFTFNQSHVKVRASGQKGNISRMVLRYHLPECRDREAGHAVQHPGCDPSSWRTCFQPRQEEDRGVQHRVGVNSFHGRDQAIFM